jgi:hypothetical protein
MMNNSLWSLLDMLRIYAEKYIALGQDFMDIESACATAANGLKEKQLSDDDMEHLAGLLIKVRKHCQEIGLKVTEGVIDEMLLDFRVPGYPEYVVVGTRIAETRRCFVSEIKSRACYMIMSERLRYYSDDASVFVSAEGLRAFPSSAFDLTEAGKCFATERFTASVSHIMKACEWPLVSFAAHAGVPEKDRCNWNKVLNEVRTKMANKRPPFDALSKEEEEYFTGLEGLLRTAKTAWRNPSSHIPRIYIESQARGLFETARFLIDSAAQKLKEVNVASTKPEEMAESVLKTLVERIQNDASEKK